MNTITYPIKLSYIAKSPIWSGERLSRDWGFESSDGKIGEIWALSVRPNEMCKVLNGEFKGQDMSDALGCKDFPLLVKLIDAGDRLSVQVHPDDAYLATHKTVETHGKTEMWYILDADEGAEIIYGLAEGVSGDDFAKAVENNEILPALKHTAVKPGDVFFIPAGLVHAIGKGILIAEVQQNCDLTYRVYDYDRIGKDGKPRELHKAQAIEVAREFTNTQIKKVQYGAETEYVPRVFENNIANCEFFRVSVLNIDGKQRIDLPKPGELTNLLCLSGEGTFGGVSIKRGESAVFTSDCTSTDVSGKLTLLASTVRVG